MPKITDTYALAYSCCETILKELSRFPTIDLIRERIGVNSPNTIKKAMNDWTAAFAQQYIEQQHSQLDCPGVPTVLTDAVYRLWQQTVAEARQTYTEQAAVLQQQLTDLQQVIEQQRINLADADQALAQAALKQETTEQRFTALNTDHDRLQAELLTTQQQEQALLKTLEAQQQREIELNEQHQQRLQQEQDWMQRRILEERELAATKWQDKHQQWEERLAFLNKHYEQALQAQKTTQTHNQQLLAEITQLKAQRTEEKSLPAHRFKRHRDRR